MYVRARYLHQMQRQGCLVQAQRSILPAKPLLVSCCSPKEKVDITHRGENSGRQNPQETTVRYLKASHKKSQNFEKPFEYKKRAGWLLYCIWSFKVNPALLCSGPFPKHWWPPSWRGEKHRYPQIKHCARAAQEQVYPKLPLQLSNGHQEPSWPLPSRGTWRVLAVGYTTHASGWSCMSDYGASCGRAWHQMSQSRQRCCTWDGGGKKSNREKKGGKRGNKRKP